MDFFRTKSKIRLSTWDDKKLIMLEMTPAIEGVKGQPKPGEIRFDKDKQCIISFHPQDALRCAWHLSKLSNGIDVKYEKHADTSKVEGRDGGEQKKLNIAKSTNDGGVLFAMVSGSNKVNIVLDYSETYAVQKFFEVTAARYI